MYNKYEEMYIAIKRGGEIKVCRQRMLNIYVMLLFVGVAVFSTLYIQSDYQEG